MVQRFAFHGRRPPAGSRPGVLALPEGGPPRHIHVIQYGAERVAEHDVEDPNELARFRNGPEVAWIEVNGLGDEAGLRRIADVFGIHPLALADVVNVPQRPKADSYEGHDLVIVWMAQLGADEDCELDQVSFVIGPQLGDQLRGAQRGRVRSGAQPHPRRRADPPMGADYLAYALVDTLIDGYYPVIEAVGDELEALEEDAVHRPIREHARAHPRRAPRDPDAVAPHAPAPRGAERARAGREPADRGRRCASTSATPTTTRSRSTRCSSPTASSR